MTEVQERILQMVTAERAIQDAKWGEQNHDLTVWSTVLGEEYGEVCQAILELRAGSGTLAAIEDELVQVAAVAVAALEYIERKYR